MPANFTERCVYTIRHSDKLRDVALAGGSDTFEAGQSWTQVKQILDQAKSEGLQVPVVFAPAEDTSDLFAWAVLEEIALRDEKPRTRYRFSRLQLLKKRPPKTSLRKASDGEALAAGFIRPYAICLTPEWVATADETGTGLPVVGAEPDPDDVDLLEAAEGRPLLRRHLVAERNRALIEAKRAATLNEYGRLACEACGFDFLAAYGERGRGFCEVHHTIPFAIRAGERVTKLADLAILCSNCHRMMHRSPLPTVADIREITIAQRGRQ
jgi:hypothetical protein